MLWVPGALSLGVKRSGGEADHLPTSSAEVRNGWSYISNPPIRLHGDNKPLLRRSSINSPRRVANKTHYSQERITDRGSYWKGDESSADQEILRIHGTGILCSKISATGHHEPYPQAFCCNDLNKHVPLLRAEQFSANPSEMRQINVDSPSIRSTRLVNVSWHITGHATYFSPWSRVLFEKLIVSQLVNKTPPFTEPECTLPCSQGPATGPYTEPDESSPFPHTLFPSTTNLTLSCHLRLGLPPCFRRNFCMHLSSPLCMLHSNLISFSVISWR
jgi:hypothetical protein